MWRVSTKRKQMMFGEWLRLTKHGSFEKSLQMESMTRPVFVGKKAVPSDLNELSFGQIIQMQGISDERMMFFVPARVILEMSEKDVMKAKAVDVVRFSVWVAKEMKRINKLFESTIRKPTEREKRAGIELLKFGVFGMVDWYALRMGLTDHEEVMSVPWMRVYKCLQMDSEKAKYQQRLRKIYEDEQRRS